ncbi:MAG: hypothetical protein WAW80_05155 [Candidatus Saccharimonadales bacterium]
MQHTLLRLHATIFNLRHIWSEEFLALFLALFIFIAPAGAIIRLQERSLLIHDPTPGATTSYTVAYRYTSPDPVGSVDMLFCIDPIPYMPCVTPPGLDVSGATLSSQSGEVGFHIQSQSTNHIVLSRTPSAPTAINKSYYTFDNIKNPTDTTQSFSIRLRTHSTTDATGPQVDVGSVKSQVANSIMLETQVPPILTFCLAEEVELGCTGTNDNYYTDMGELSNQSTLTARSQMAVGTNATAGFAITVSGEPPAAGANVIDSPSSPTDSKIGSNQFGINLVANNEPVVGDDPEGIFANAIPSPDYSVPNKYKYVPGDVVAYSPNVSLMKKFTVSYILNSSPNLRAGIYSTTITYTASGRF